MKKFLALLLALAMVFALAACGSTSTSTANDTASVAEEEKEAATAAEELSILVMPKLVGIPWFNASDVGAKRAGEELGINVIYAGPTQADAAEQVKMIEDYLNQGVSAICIAPNDPTAVKPVLNTATDNGIYVLDWDTPADIEDVNYSVQSVDPVVYGEQIWQDLVDAMGTDEGEYAIITGGLEAAGLNQWIDAGIAYAEKNYPNLVLVTDPIPSNEVQQEAYARTLDLIKTYPNLKGIIGISTPAPIGAAQAIQEKGLQDQIAVVGTTLPNDARQYIKDGSLDRGEVEANPETLGYVTVYIAYNAIMGEKIETGLEIPGVGSITVYENGKTCIIGPPLVLTKDNIDDYDF